MGRGQVLISGLEKGGTNTGLRPLRAAAFAHKLRLTDDGGRSGEISHTQGMLLDGKLQFMNGRHPFRSLFVEGSGTQFANAIFETARGHKGRHRTSRPP